MQYTAFIAAFTSERMIDDNKKMFIPHLAIENNFFHSAFVNVLCTVVYT